jgi:hypothetical protein
MAHSVQATTMLITILMMVAYIAIRLTFGSSPSQQSWCIFSEIMTDLANNISSCLSYNPALLCSLTQPKPPAPKLSESTAPLARAVKMAVCIHVTHTARVDGLSDNLINMFLDTEENREREPHVIPLTMHCTSRPHSGDQEPAGEYSRSPWRKECQRKTRKCGDG